MASFELKALSGGSFALLGGVTAGFYSNERAPVLIDSGGDRSAGSAIRKTLGSLGQKPAWVACTHFHADHVGGCAYLKKNTGCSVAMPALEKPLLEDTSYEGALLWGASPFPALKNKFLMAPPCKVDLALTPPCHWEETGLKVISLSGHSPGMVGYVTPDSVAYVGDGLFGSAMIRKHGLLFVADVAEWLVTLDFLETLEADWFVPYHEEPVRDPGELIQTTRRHLLDISDRVRTLCRTPSTRDDLLGGLMEWLGKKIDPVRYVLNLGALSAHLTYLMERGEVEAFEERGRLLWHGL